MASRTRLTDIAKVAGVSTATVSRVLNGRRGVAEETRRAVLSALDVLGYERPEKLRAKTAGRIGLVIPEISNPVFPTFAQTIETHLSAAGFIPMLCTQSPGGITEDQYVEMLVQHDVEGIIFIAGLHADVEADTTRYHQLLANGVPFVFINGTNPAVQVPSFAIDEARAMDLAVRHLSSLGHTRIGLATGQRRYFTSRGKITGFRSAMRRHCGTEDPKFVSTFFGFAGGAAAGGMLLDSGCTAIICGSDLMALGAIQQARARGREVPTDVSVTGFDDGPFLVHTNPPLTTLRQPVDAISRSAVASLLDLIDGSPVPRTEILFAPELIVRGSTGSATSLI
ncbi:MAG TPA: LacI family DNA-binding transcriptional regulator [Actinomycetaceae bacterium]|nr:LacI family DNA-binding transcriptional regulator [Actinomycetaceae bacterium]